VCFDVLKDGRSCSSFPIVVSSVEGLRHARAVQARPRLSILTPFCQGQAWCPLLGLVPAAGVLSYSWLLCSKAGPSAGSARRSHASVPQSSILSVLLGSAQCPNGPPFPEKDRRPRGGPSVPPFSGWSTSTAPPPTLHSYGAPSYRVPSGPGCHPRGLEILGSPV